MDHGFMLHRVPASVGRTMAHEIRRVLKPEGRALLVDFGPPKASERDVFLPGSPSGVVTNEGNSWNYAASAPSNGNLPIGTKVWNTAVVAGGAPGWVRVSGAWKAMANVAA
ncbi:hypothetical protein ASD38_02395 [Caulobacter sp. Root487D2Y]|nr:hypothetical protein ASD38_02395 [Caulobacter sp. Root487D2Y]